MVLIPTNYPRSSYQDHVFGQGNGVKKLYGAAFSLIDSSKDGGDLISHSISRSFCRLQGIDNFRDQLVGEAYSDEGFYMGSSRQRWGDIGVKKQLSL